MHLCPGQAGERQRRPGVILPGARQYLFCCGGSVQVRSQGLLQDDGLFTLGYAGLELRFLHVAAGRSCDWAGWNL